MSQATVDRIVAEIQTLSDDERAALDQRLAEIDEAAWHAEAVDAREAAAQAGVDQQTIDRQVEQLRHG